jgi:general secretion pathway protein C
MTLVAVSIAIAGSFAGRGVADLFAIALPVREVPPAPSLVVVSPVEIAEAPSGGLFGAGGEEGPESSPTPRAACGSDLRVRAIVVGFERDGASYASISHAAGTAFVRPGARLGEYEVRSIARERVTLAHGRDRCELALFAPEERADPPPIAQLTDSSPLDGGVEAIDPFHYRVERRIIEHLLANRPEAMGLARVIPQREGDRVVGVKIYGVRRGSLLSRMGLENGDAIRTVNGFDVGSPDQVLAALVALRDARRVSVAIVRRGAPSTLDYEIAD